MKLPRSIIIRTYLLYFLVVIAMVVVIGKTFMVIIDGRQNVFSTESKRLEQRTAEVSARRGEILDIHLNPLVTSVSFYDLYMDPVTVKEKLWQEEVGSLSIGLSKIFTEKTAREWEEYLREARKRGRRFVLLQKKVTNEIRKQIRELPILNQGRFKGGLIDNQMTIVRKRPNSDLLRRTLGYVRYNEKDTLLVGLEGAYNSYLKGQSGLVLEQRIAQSWKPTGSVVREAVNGYDLVTSIDKEIQEVAHTELLNQLKKKGGRFGTAVVMEVKTGYIKAIVNLEGDTLGNYREIYNHAIGTREVPGSTIKLASLMAALEDNKIKMSDTVYAGGRYEFHDRTLTDDKKEGYGKITIKEAFEHSSNVIGKVIYDNYKNDPERYIQQLKKFGLTEKTGINIKGEAIPTYAAPGTKQWWGGSLAWLAIGYEFQITPLQLLAFYNAVANDGKYMKPQLVTRVIDNNKTIQEFPPIVSYEQIARQETIDAMKDALEGVVEEGTAKKLQSAFFKIAGKTGTAQIANRNEGYGPKGERKYIASFVGYFPADDPIYSCVVVIAAPTRDIYGVSVSGTVFSAIANKVYASSYNFHKAVNEKELLVNMPKTLDGGRYDLEAVLRFLEIKKEINGNGTAEWIKRTSATDDKIVFADNPIDKNSIPDVRGLGLIDAMYLLEQRGLVVKTEGYGHVVLQSIRPGTPAVKGALIKLTLK